MSVSSVNYQSTELHALCSMSQYWPFYVLVLESLPLNYFIVKAYPKWLPLTLNYVLTHSLLSLHSYLLQLIRVVWYLLIKIIVADTVLYR